VGFISKAYELLKSSKCVVFVFFAIFYPKLLIVLRNLGSIPLLESFSTCLGRVGLKGACRGLSLKCFCYRPPGVYSVVPVLVLARTYTLPRLLMLFRTREGISESWLVRYGRHSR
jgi:hypothetical protein